MKGYGLSGTNKGKRQRFFLKPDRKFVQIFDFFVQKMKKRRDISQES